MFFSDSLIIFVGEMVKVFKYLLFAAIISAFSAVAMQRDAGVSAIEIDTFSEIKDLCEECTQYQYAAYESQNDFAVASASYSFSSNVRLQSGGKRTGQGGTRFTQGIIKQGKTIAQGVRFSHSYFRHSMSITFTQPGGLLIRLGKLII